MLNAHNQDTYHVLNGEFGARATTQVVAKLCPLNNTKSIYELSIIATHNYRWEKQYYTVVWV